MDATRIVVDLAKGAFAGVVAGRAMGQVTTLIYEREDPRARQLEEQARGGKHAFEVAAEKGARLVGRELSEKERKRLGSLIHRGLAVAAGALYGALRTRARGVSAGRGLLFGAAFFLVVDEAMNAALRFTPGPRAFPWQAHARGLAGHLAFGMSAEAQLRALDRILP